MATAVAVLDAGGEGALTFRTLTERLATGAGAVYWHVANKGELLDAATDAVVAAALAGGGDASPDASPEQRVRALASGLFDAIEEHPWVAGRLSASSYQSTTPRIFEHLGREVAALGLPAAARFRATSVLVEYILGAAGQNAANSARARALGDTDRAAALDAAARDWARLDPEDYRFTRTVADQLRTHDDRAEFLAGVDVVLAGIAALHGADGEPRWENGG